MFELPDSLTIHNVKDVQDDLLSLLPKLMKDASEGCVLDAVNLQDMDAAGLQLLLAAQKSFNAEGISFRVINRGEMIEKLLELSGAVEYLDGGGVSQQ